MTIQFETAAYLTPLLAFAKQYGLMVVGGIFTLAALTGRKFGPLAIIPLVIGLGICVAGAAHLLPLLGK